MDPSAYMHQYGSNSGPPNQGHLPQGSKLATYMNRHSYHQQPQQQHYNVSDINKGLVALNLDSNTLKKLTMSGIRDFVPQPSQSQVNLGSSARYAVGGNPSPSGGLRLPNNPTPAGAPSFSPSSFGSERVSATSLNTPPPSMMSNSPRQSPTPASVGLMNSGAVQTADPSAASISIYNEGGTTYFYPGDEMSGMSEPMVGVNGGRTGSVMVPNFSIFIGSPSHVASSKARKNTPSFVAQSDVKMEILKKQYICMSQIDPDTTTESLPDVDNFQHLVPLEAPPPSPLHKSHTFGYSTSVYKATNVKSGFHVCLRRIHSFRLVNTKCMVLVDQWKKLHHSNLVSLKQVFTTKSFGDHSMVFIYDFFAGAETLMTKHFSNSSQLNSFADPFSGADTARPYSQHKNQQLRQQAMMTQNGLLPESMLWNYIIQLTAGLRHIHSASLACRTLDPTKILLIGGSNPRLLLNCCGIFDVLTFDPTSSNPMAAMAHYQQEDLIALGKIVLALACNSFLAIQRENLQTSMEIVTSTYSSDLRNFIMYLLTNPTRIKSVNDLMPMIGARFYNQLDASYNTQDALEVELAKEIESSRTFFDLDNINLGWVMGQAGLIVSLILTTIFISMILIQSDPKHEDDEIDDKEVDCVVKRWGPEVISLKHEVRRISLVRRPDSPNFDKTKLQDSDLDTSLSEIGNLSFDPIISGESPNFKKSLSKNILSEEKKRFPLYQKVVDELTKRADQPLEIPNQPCNDLDSHSTMIMGTGFIDSLLSKTDHVDSKIVSFGHDSFSSGTSGEKAKFWISNCAPDDATKSKYVKNSSLEMTDKNVATAVLGHGHDDDEMTWSVLQRKKAHFNVKLIQN